MPNRATGQSRITTHLIGGGSNYAKCRADPEVQMIRSTNFAKLIKVLAIVTVEQACH
jgi:hypothetical protein